MSGRTALPRPASRRPGARPATRLAARVAVALAVAATLAGPSPLAAQEDGPAATAASAEEGWSPAERLGGQVRRGVAERWGVDSAAVRLDWGPAPRSRRPAENARPRLVGSGVDGRWVVRLRGREGGGFGLRLRAGAMVRVPVAAEPLGRGEALTAEDIAREDRVRWGPPDERGFEVAPGWVARRSIRAGETLTRPAVSPPALVRSGQQVRVIFETARVRLSVPGEAVGTAKRGERVRVRLRTGRRVRGRAEAPGRVRVPGAAETGAPTTGGSR